MNTFKSTLAILVVSFAHISAAQADDENLRRSLYVENAMSKVQVSQVYGDIVTLSILNDEFVERGSHLSAEDIQALQDYVNQRSDDIRKINQVAASSSAYHFGGDTRDTVSAWLALGRDVGGEYVGKIADIADDLLNVGGRTVDTMFGSSAQESAQTTALTQQDYFATHGRDVLIQTLENAVNDPNGFGKLLDLTFSSTFGGVKVSSSVSDILAANPALATNQALTEIRNALNNSSTTDQAVQTLLTNLDSNLRAQLGDTATIIANLQKIDQEQDQARREAKRNQARQDLQTNVANAQASLYLLQTFVNFLNPALAKEVSTIGTSVIDISRSIASFQLGDISSIVLTGNVVSAVTNLLNMGGGNSSVVPIMLEEFKKVHEDIDALRKEMRERFDQIDIKLNMLNNQISDGFANLEQQLAANNAMEQENFAAIRGSLADLSRQLARSQADLERLTADVYAQLNTLSQRTFEEDKTDCLDVQFDTPGYVMTTAEFRSCLGKFKTWAIKNMRDSLATGGDRSLDDDKVLAELQAYPLETNLDYLVALAINKFGAINLLTYQNIGNPAIWAAGSAGYAQIVHDSPVVAHSIGLSVNPINNEILPPGEKFLTLGRAIRQTAGTQGPVINRGFYESLLSRYKAHLNEMSNSLEAEIATKDREKNQGILIDYAAGASQHTSYTLGLTSMGPCDPAFNDHGARPQLERPTQLEAILPPEVILAEQMGLGKVQGCYSAQIDAQRLQLSIQISFHMQRPVVVDLPIVQRQITTGWDRNGDPDQSISAYLVYYWHGQQHFYDTIFSTLIPGVFKWASTTNLAGEVTLAMGAQADEIAQSLAHDIGDPNTPIGDEAQKLGGDYQLIVDFLLVSMPGILNNDDGLRSVLFGDNRVFDNVLLAQYLADGSIPGTLRLGNVSGELVKRKDGLTTELEKVLDGWKEDQAQDDLAIVRSAIDALQASAHLIQSQSSNARP